MINYQELIVYLINFSGGLKYKDLILSIIEKANPVIFDKTEFINALEGLIEDEIIIQVLYENGPDGAKVMYFPKGTIFWFGS